VVDEMFLERQPIFHNIDILKLLVIALIFFIIISLNNANAQCPKIVIQGKVTSIDKDDAANCEFYILVENVIQGYGLRGLDNMKLVPGISVYTRPYPCSNIQVGDCVEVYGTWCEGDSPPIYGCDGWYVKKIACPSGPPPQPKCRPGPVGSPQCSGNAVKQLYQDANCNQYWQVMDDCNRYIPSKCCKNGGCEKCGCQETYRCANNAVQRLCIGADGTENWQVFDDCNRYDPPRSCKGGACISDIDRCDQQVCQAKNEPVDDPYCKDGKTYRDYLDCSCDADGKCNCDNTLPKETRRFDDPMTSYNEGLWRKGQDCPHDNILSRECPDHIQFPNGKWMSIRLDDSSCSSSGSICPEERYFSGGYVTNCRYDYGHLEGYLKAAKGSGVVNGFFIYDGDPDNPGNVRAEIDIEILGNDTTHMSVNYWRNGVRREEPVDPINLGFDASEGFNKYAIDWSKDTIKWSVNNQLVWTEDGHNGWAPEGPKVPSKTSLPTPPGRVILNLWAWISLDPRDPNGWAGEFNYANEPIYAYFKDIEYSQT
jgi:endo-1,3-1,4-beta-glycanase ExoK